MAISKKYNGKTFADIANSMTDTYKDRHDPISKRTLTKSLADLREAQEYKKELQAQQEQMAMQEQMPMQQQQQMPMSSPMGMPMGAGNQGISFDAPEQVQTFKREASADYNNKFGDGGETENVTKNFLTGMAPPLQRAIFEKTLQMDNPLTGETELYGDFRKNLLLNRTKLNTYLEGKRSDESVEQFIENRFNEKYEEFLSDERNKKQLGFDPEVISQAYAKDKTKSRGLTKYQQSLIDKANAARAKEASETLESNLAIDKSTTQRLDADKEAGLRDMWGNLAIDDNEYAKGGSMNFKSSGAYNKWLGYVHANKLAEKTPGHQKVSIQGKPHKVEHDVNKFSFGGAGMAMSAAPIVSNLIEYFTTKKPDAVPRRQIDKSFLNTLRSFKPRQSTFKDVDINDVERGIVEGSGRFSQANKQASRGSSSSFIANEIANQNNLSKAIAQARMNAQVQDRQTAQLRAGEQARIDSILGQQNAQAAAMEGQINMRNTFLQHQADVEDAQNLAAYQARKSQLMNSAVQGIAGLGNTFMTNQMAINSTGYGFLGDWFGGKGSGQSVVDQNSLNSNPYYQLTRSNANGGLVQRLRKLRR